MGGAGPLINGFQTVPATDNATETAAAAMANGHGGARPGAGAPRGGVSELRRSLERALLGGMADAGRAKGLIGPDEIVGSQVARVIVREMVEAGEGDRVLALASQVALKSGSDGAGSGSDDDPLSRSLGRIGAGNATQALPPQQGNRESHDNSTGYDDGAADYGSAVPLESVAFARQRPLLPALEPLEPPGRAGASGARPGAPPPPPAPTRVPYTLDGEIFENFSVDDQAEKQHEP